MGSHLQTEDVTNEDLETYNKENPARPERSFFPRETTTDKLISIAVRNWYDDPDSDHGSARTGTPFMQKVTPEELIEPLNTWDMVTDRSTVVVPLMDRRDYALKTATMPVKLNGEEWASFLRHDNSILTNKVLEVKPELAGKIALIQVVALDGKADYSPYSMDKWKVSSTIEADASGGKAKNVYYVALGKQRLDNFNYATQALAREAALDYMKTHTECLGLSVEAKVIREDASSLVNITRKVKQATAKILVTYVNVKADNPRSKGWVVGFNFNM